MKFVRKTPAEVMPLVFDFRHRLNGLSDGAIIKPPILALEVTPAGALSLGLPQDALIDELSGLEVAVVATGGTVNTIYSCRCRAQIEHSGGEYVFDVAINMVVVE